MSHEASVLIRSVNGAWYVHIVRHDSATLRKQHWMQVIQTEQEGEMEVIHAEPKREELRDRN